MYIPKTEPEIPVPHDISKKARLTYDRIVPGIDRTLAGSMKESAIFFDRLDGNFESLFRPFYQLYGNRYDFYFHLEDLISRMAITYSKRKKRLKKRDTEKEKNPTWFRSEKMVGGICYVDLYAWNLKKLEKKIPYFKKLGLTFIHLMPFFKCPDKENDGGYAVSSYRDVRADLGKMKELENLSEKFHENGINIIADFINNHTSDEFLWAKRAIEGEEEFMDYYYTYSDRTIPDQYDASTREIFPDVRRGNFSYKQEIDRWVWTTFHNYQWDLNYKNPLVFNSIAEELLLLANRGIDVLRMDAVAFTWKKLGTDCENLPEAHFILQTLNAISNIVCPGLLLKSEAIVHPDEVNRYIDKGECQISYNPLLMALSWESLATRETKLLTHSMKKRFSIGDGCSWVNYVRCHDDIGWTFSDDDAADLGINGYNHRRFLNQFYSGDFPGSFSKGVPFQHNPDTGDMRICGSAASLTGLEKGLDENFELDIKLSKKRVMLLYSVAYSIGGVPLLYLGDEWGVLNDYSYLDDPGKTYDSRWVQRPNLKRGKKSKLVNKDVANELTGHFETLAKLRANEQVLGDAETIFPDQIDPHLFTFVRSNGVERMLVIANFCEQTRTVNVDWITDQIQSAGFTDLFTKKKRNRNSDLKIEPYQVLWIKPD